MAKLVPYIMPTRTGSQNFIFDKIGMEKIDKYIKRKQEEGLAGLTLMHVIIGAYCRAVSQRPAINRFIRGQKIYSRKKIEISLVVKKDCKIDADLVNANPGDSFQFMRNGYFCVDKASTDGKLVFNRTVALNTSWK